MTNFIRFVYPITLIFCLLILVLNLEVLIQIENSNFIEKLSLLLFLAVSLFFGGLNKVAFLSILLMCFLVSVSALFTRYEYFDVGIWFVAVFQIFAVFGFFAISPSIGNLSAFLKIVSHLSVLTLALGGVYTVFGIHEIVRWEFATGLPRLQGSLIPAYLGGVSVASFVSALVVGCVDRNRWYLLLSIVSLVILVFSMSRTALLVAMICGGAFLLVYYNKIGFKVWVVWGAGFAGIIFLAVFWEVLYTRMVEGGMNGRQLIWDYVLYLSGKYPDFGIGFGHQYYSTPHELYVLTRTYAAHNDYLRLRLELGFIISLLFFLLMAVTLYSPVKDVVGRMKRYYLISISTVFLFCITDNFISTPHIFIYSIVCYYSAVYSSRVGLRSYG